MRQPILKLIDLIIKAKKLELSYVVFDSDGFCSGYVKEPHYKSGKNLIGEFVVNWYGDEYNFLGQYNGYISDATKAIINISEIKL